MTRRHEHTETHFTTLAGGRADAVESGLFDGGELRFVARLLEASQEFLNAIRRLTYSYTMRRATGDPVAMFYLNFEDFVDDLTIVSGEPKSAQVSLFSVVRNESYFLPAFFAHYRSIGVEQFFILDDRSSDGTRAFLEEQHDCVTLTSRWNFGDLIIVKFPEGRWNWQTAGTVLKRAIPTRFLKGNYAVYADADEFLILPSRFSSLRQLFELLRDNDCSAVAASLVDFYPARLSDLFDSSVPRTSSDLLRLAGYFDAVPLVSVSPGKRVSEAMQSASVRLFKSFSVQETRHSLSWLPSRVQELMPRRTPRAAWYKTPIIRWDDKTWMAGSHDANVPPTAHMLLAMIHFKFTPDFQRRIDEARIRRAHARKSQKYDSYNQLLEKMSLTNAEFLGPKSLSFSSVEDFVSCGLMFDNMSSSGTRGSALQAPGAA